MEDLLTVKNLSVSYGDTKVLNDLSFNIKDEVEEGYVRGQLVSVIGPSGSGKTTLFRALAGLKDYSGDIILRDIKNDVAGDKIAPESGLVGLVDQKYTMFRHKTVRQALKSVLKKRHKGFNSKTNKLIDDAMIDKHAKIIGIEHVLDKYPNELSGGQRQRAALLERLLNGNHYLILDEPFSGLDVKSKDDSKEFMRNIVNGHELNTILFSTHNIRTAVEMSDVILVIKNGTIVFNTNLRNEGYSYGSYTLKHSTLESKLIEILKK